MTEPLNFQLPENGFGNYVKSILPPDQAVLAGAFASSMSQIKNVQYSDLETFAQVVYSIETNNGLPLVNGTNVPTDTFLVNQALSKMALGSDISGTFNMSNFIGSISGLPYPLGQIYNLISALETANLYQIYDDLYLAVKWEPATATVNYETRAVETSAGPPPVYQYEYRINSVTLTNPGGGYSREGAPAPTGTFTGAGYSGDGGATVTFTIDEDPNNVPGTYGSLTVSSTQGTWVTYATGQSSPSPTDPGLTLEIEAPPLSNAGETGTNSAYTTDTWKTALNTIIDNYVIIADAEISAIQNAAPETFEAANVLNTYWNMCGLSLKIEQRARYRALPPVAIPYFKWLTPYPLALVSFLDNMPTVAEDTCPNGPAQNMENTVDLCEAGGQSLIGLMRELRNQQRLMAAGLELDNTISDEIPEDLDSQQCVNGTVPGAVEGIPSVAGDYTLPSWPEVKSCQGEPARPGPYTYYDPNYQGLRKIGFNPNTPIIPIGDDNNGGFGITGGGLPYNPGNISVILNLNPESLPPVITDNTGNIIPEFPVSDPENPDIPVVIVNQLVPIGPSVPIGPGGKPLPDLPIFPTANVLPFRLNADYFNATLLPSQYNVSAAIDKVIECNCDCWVN